MFDDRGETWIMTRRINDLVDIAAAGDNFTARSHVRPGYGRDHGRRRRVWATCNWRR